MTEHRMATMLYRRFKVGSNTLTTYEAFNIGNELDRQASRIVELETALALAKRTIDTGAQELRGLASEIRANVESLGKAS